MKGEEGMSSVEGWENRKLIDIAEIKGGKRLPAGEQFSEEVTAFPYIRVTDMVNGTINDKALVYVKPTIEPLIRNYKISSQDLYVTIAGTLGQFGRIPEHLDGSQLTENAAKITKIDTSRVASNYLCQYLRSEQVSKQVAIATGTGGGVPKLPLYQIEQFLIQYPSLPEQTKIAEILSTLDRAIEQTEALIAKQQRIKTGLMQDLLTRGIDEHGNLRSERTHKFKDSPLGRIPVEWGIRELGTVAMVTKLAGFEFTDYFDYRSGGKIIALRALNIKNERLDFTNIQRIPKAVSDKLPRSKIFADDILITYIGAYIGDILRIEESDKYHLAPNIAKIVAGKLLAPEFLEVFLRASLVQRQIKNLTAVTATPSLTMTQIRKLFIAIPKDDKEQYDITSRIRSISKALNSIETESNKLHSLKTALMQDLLTGRKRVHTLLNDKEVARV